jgi:hypothetical protein
VFVQVEGVPQVPIAVHVDTALSEPPPSPVAHSVAPGEHTPWHEALVPFTTHAWLVQVTGVPHMPDALHNWTAELPEHCVAPGLHVPWHEATPASATTHAAFPQATAAPQFPVLSHVCTPWPMH